MGDGLSAATILTEYSKQFTELFTVIPFVVTFEDDSIATSEIYAGGGLVTVTGAKLGDLVFVAPELDIADLQFHAQVQAADKVEIVLTNNTGGTLTTFAAGAVINGMVWSLKPGFWSEIT